MKPAAFQATFADFRIVKGRKQAQFVFEVPLEAANAALATLGGVPMPDKEAWVAVARINQGPVSEVPKASDDRPEDWQAIDAMSASERGIKPHRKFTDLPYPTQAAMRCNETAFATFLTENFPGLGHTSADAVRAICGVLSRADLATDNDASCKWAALELKYRLWLREPEIVE